jgi:hypothetical protein
MDPRCPSCREEIFAALPMLAGQRLTHGPQPGEIGVCDTCEAVLVVEADGFRLATDADVATVPESRRAELLSLIKRRWQ